MLVWVYTVRKEVLFSNCDDRSKSNIAATHNFRQGEMSIKHRGVPLIFTRIKLEHCSHLISKLRQRLSCWKAKPLSFAGIIEPIKSTLNYYANLWSMAGLDRDLLEQLLMLLFRGKCGKNTRAENLYGWNRSITNI